MNNPNPAETRPIPVNSETHPTSVDDVTPQEGETRAVEAGLPLPDDAHSSTSIPAHEIEAGPAGRTKAWRWLLVLCFISLFIIAAASALGGYRSGIQQRLHLEASMVASQVREQFELGVQDMEAGRLEVARQRFEYVVQNDPGYPGVIDQLATVLLRMNTTATATPVPTPTLTPTPDLRGAEELFSQAQVSLAASDWNTAIDTLLKLRKDEPGYQPVQVDAMLFVSLRNRGVDKILLLADLEGGTYDLALAEQFGPLDVEASNYRNWADLYMTGASFWDLDWEQAIYYFGQIYQVAPNLRDRSNLTATERYRIALFKFADFLAESGDWCRAEDQYAIALNFSSDPTVEPTAVYAAEQCEEAEKPKGEGRGGRNNPTEPSPVETTPTPGEGAPTEPPPTPEASPTTETTPPATGEPYPPPSP